MKTLRTSAALAAIIALLAACGEERTTEVRKELEAMAKDLRGKVDPLPPVKTNDIVNYKGESMLDPFVPGRIVVAQAVGTGGGGGIQPDLNRPKEPLEAFPLEAIQWVGTLSQNEDVYALVRAGTILFRVKKGNYMGQNFGQITAIEIDEKKSELVLKLKEVVQDSGGDWVERSTELQMQEGKR